MPTPWSELTTWLVQIGGLGLLLFGLGWLWVRRIETPLWRYRVASLMVRFALVVVVMTVLPAWWTIPVPQLWSHASKPDAKEIPATTPPTMIVRRLDSPQVDRNPGPTPEVKAQPRMVEHFGGFAWYQPETTSARVQEAPEQSQVDTSTASVTQLALHDVLKWAMISYLAVLAVLIAEILLGLWSLARLTRQTDPIPPRLQRLYQQLSQDWQQAPRLVLSSRVQSPLCFGIWQPVILLPTQMAESESEQQLRWILAHELDHLQRGDHHLAHWVAITRAVFFFVPWFWKIRKELQRAQEYLADQAAVQAGGDPIEYAAFLVELTGTKQQRHLARRPLSATGVEAEKSELFRRVNMVLNVQPVQGKSHWRWWHNAVIATLVFGILAGSSVNFTLADDPKPAQPPAPPAPPAPPKPVELPAPQEEKLPPVANLELRKKFEEQMKQFDEMIEKLGDDKEGREQIEKAKEEFRKAMEESLKKADELQEQMEKERKNRRVFPGGNLFGGQLQVVPLPPGVELPNFPGMGQFQFGNGGAFGLGRNLGTPRIGVMLEVPSDVLTEQLDLPKGEGLVIVEVLPDMPAAKAGLKANDILLQFGDTKVRNNIQDFQDLVRDLKAGTKVDIVVLRKGKKESLKAFEMPEMPKPPALPAFPNMPGFAPLVPGATQMQVQISDGDVSIQATVNGVKYDIAGALDGGNFVANTIKVTDGNESESYESLEKVPEQYQADIKKLMGYVRGK